MEMRWSQSVRDDPFPSTGLLGFSLLVVIVRDQNRAVRVSSHSSPPRGCRGLLPLESRCSGRCFGTPEVVFVLHSRRPPA